MTIFCQCKQRIRIVAEGDSSRTAFTEPVHENLREAIVESFSPSFRENIEEMMAEGMIEPIIKIAIKYLTGFLEADKKSYGEPPLILEDVYDQ